MQITKQELINKIIDMHIHLLCPETTPLKVFAGEIGINPETIQLLWSVYKGLPSYSLQLIENIIELATGKDTNITAVLQRYFGEYKQILEKYQKDCGDMDINPVILHVYESEVQGILCGYDEAFSALPGGIPEFPEVYQAIKSYPKLNGKPSDEILQHANDNGIPILAHCSRGGIWGADFFESEKAANEAAHPVSWIPVLERFPTLKLVLCHGGGDSDFVEAGTYLADEDRYDDYPPENNWTLDCLDVIDLYPHRVWIDTAYHQSCVTRSEIYRIALQAILYLYPNNIVFGSDWPLVLKDVDSYEQYVTAMATAAGPFWHKMSYRNACRALGIYEG